MRPLRFRVRSLLVAVAIVAVLIWAVRMGSRSYVYYQLARQYSFNELDWRLTGANGRFRREFSFECANYFAKLAAKYRRAMWRPWQSVEPDPLAPGVAEYLEQQRREAANTHTNK